MQAARPARIHQESETSMNGGHIGAFQLLCSEKIGSGMSRQVYTGELFPDCVTKVEAEGRFQNVMEWETWRRVEHTAYAKWFAPCRWISDNGRVLVMEKTRPAIESEFPEKIPVFLTDTKRANFGVLNGRLVCHDYGSHLLMENGMVGRMKKAAWWDG